jgi:large subunit ribosomal protein L6
MVNMAEKNKKSIEAEIELPDKVEARVDGTLVAIKGPKGEIKRNIAEPCLDIAVKERKIVLSTKTDTKKEKKTIYANEEHIKNMVSGVVNSHVYTLKICSGHFPMNVSVSNNQIILKNFLGEKYPRILKLRQGVNVKIEGDKIIVEGVDKELAGTTASAIEGLTRRPGFDGRIFQDGIYIINKDGKEIK